MNVNLNYEGYEDYLLRRNYFNEFGFERVQYVFKFDNHYGASVIKGYGSYGYYEDLWELAVLNFGDGDDKGYIDYSTPITDDVKGYLTDKVVRHTLNRIKKLPCQ